jgi:hypothetical protein
VRFSVSLCASSLLSPRVDLSCELQQGYRSRHRLNRLGRSNRSLRASSCLFPPAPSSEASE